MIVRQALLGLTADKMQMENSKMAMIQLTVEGLRVLDKGRKQEDWSNQ